MVTGTAPRIRSSNLRQSRAYTTNPVSEFVIVPLIHRSSIPSMICLNVGDCKNNGVTLKGDTPL